MYMYIIWYAITSYIQNIEPEFCVRGCDIARACAISHPRTQNKGPIFSI